MSEIKDPRIKLFGKTIELPEAVVTAGDDGAAAVPICVAAAEYCSDQDLDCSSNSVLEDGNCRRDKEEQGSCKSPNHAVDETGRQFSTIDDSTGHSSDTDTGSMKPFKAEEDHLQTNNSHEKSLKKPDKILPCPRCNSMDTKFCYFNNYNVSQPRHFCKNCQRYWTAGGTMRNVPVGAGRRKNKNAISLIPQVTIPEAEAIQSARMEISNGIHPKGTTLLTFSSDSPLCESMTSALSIVDKTTGLHKHEAVGISVSHGSKEHGDDPSCGSSSVAASSKDEASKSGLPPMMPNCHSFVQQVPCYPGTPSPFHWNLVQWHPPGSPPAFSLASFQMPLYSASPPYWGCAIPPSSWIMPWIIPPTLVASQGHTAPNSPTLGKHSRDDTILKQKDEEEVIKESSSSEKCLWVPKTLRINDPGEAAKSSIWSTLGIKNDRDDSVGGRGLFKAFQRQSRGSGKSPAQQTSPVLQANPAAFSRSVSFHEST